MKYKKDIGNFVQGNRNIFNGKYPTLHRNSRWLYCVLSELEHRFTGEKEDFFFRTLQDLSDDTGMKPHTIIRHRKLLVEVDLIHTWQMHWVNPETGKKSPKKVTAYRLLH